MSLSELRGTCFRVTPLIIIIAIIIAIIVIIIAVIIILTVVVVVMGLSEVNGDWDIYPHELVTHFYDGSEPGCVYNLAADQHRCCVPTDSAFVDWSSSGV